jgi:tRNA threonylcarbamoyl adenosine modification protein YeaZ
MRVLALDTTTAAGSVALVRGGRVEGEVRLASAASHSARLLPAVRFLLTSLELRPDDVEGYAVATGPGSFTGMRVGIATVQGLALAAPRPCVGLVALDVLAARIRGTAAELVGLMDAAHRELFGARYDREGRLLGGHRVGALEDLLEGVSGGAAFLGDAVGPNRERIREACPGALFPDRSLFLAGTLGRLAEGRLKAGEGISAAGLRPLYLREAAIRQARPS